MTTGAMIVLVCAIGIAAYFLLRYLEGDLTIQSIEEVQRNSYNVSTVNSITGDNEIPRGKMTRVVYKITYQSKRIKFKTESYSH
jgi:hypothetical protein